MMTLLLRLFAAAAFVTLPAVASATVINFDVDGVGAPIAGGTAITTQYSALGVTFEGLEDGSPAAIEAGNASGFTGVSVPHALLNCTSISSFCSGTNRADIVRVIFASAVSNISLQLSSLGDASITLNLYDSANALLETQSVTTGSGSSFTLVTFAAAGVSRIEGVQPDDSWAWAMDDLTFTSAVPAPGALALLGAGLAGLAAMRRRA